MNNKINKKILNYIVIKSITVISNKVTINTNLYNIFNMKYIMECKREIYHLSAVILGTPMNNHKLPV